MDADGLLRYLRAEGFDVEPHGDGRLAVSPADRLTDELRDAIRRHKPELLERLAPDYPHRPCADCGGRTFYLTEGGSWACLSCEDVPERVPRRWWIGPTKWLREESAP